MIGKVTRGRDLGGLLRYLFGPGRANEHTRPHLVASWRGDHPEALADLEPARDDGRVDVAPLAARMSLPLQLHPDADRPVWQCSMRTAPGDRRLSDAEWAGVARDVLHRTGFAPHGDPAGCRWVAVRHADDHIHIAVVLARMDGHPVETFRDWPKVHAAARAAEHRLGLQIVPAPSRADRTAGRSPSRAEIEKAHRTTSHARAGIEGRETARRWLTRQVRAAAAGSSSRQEFVEHLAARGVLVTWRYSQRTPGQVTGYAVARPGDVDGAGRQVWFGGSTLAADLSLPRLAVRWSSDGRAARVPGRRTRGRLQPPGGTPHRGRGGRRGAAAAAGLARFAESAADEPNHAARIAVDLARVARTP